MDIYVYIIISKVLSKDLEETGLTQPTWQAQLC